MKTRTLLLSANITSVFVILIFLVISYVRMFLADDAIILLTLITMGAGFLSIIINLLIISPLLKSVKQMADEAKRMASGDFNITVTSAGPQEFKELAQNFNYMSTKIHEMFEELKQSERFKSELVANVSHDLRTPLSSIHSFAAALNDGIIEEDETRKRYYETILAETEKLKFLIEDVLELSHLEHKNILFTPVPTPIDRLVIDTIQPFERDFQENSIAVELNYDDNLSTVPLMPQQIKRVMMNFIQNALSFSPANTKIQIEVKQEKKSLYFSVTDEGIGVPLEEQTSIFQRFYRVEKSRHKSKGGSGLGLAICQEIIELHNGQIGVKSDGIKGSTFWFRLPLTVYKEEEQ
jgi:two-component system sensor histidine kinase SaeS